MEASNAALDLEKTLIPWVGRTSKLMHIYLKQQFDQLGFDLTPKQWVILKILMHEDGREQNHLAIVTERDKTSLTRMITNMESKGLVERRTSPQDKRVNLLYLTLKGRSVFNKSAMMVQKAIEAMEISIDPEELEITKRTMKKIHDHVKELTIQNQDN